MSTVPQFQTLADCGLPPSRCSGCAEEFSPTARVEVYATDASTWVIVKCKDCKVCTPFQLEKAMP